MGVWPLAADGALQVTTDLAGAHRVVNGFVRRTSDGAIVVADQATAGVMSVATMDRGFVRSKLAAPLTPEPAPVLVYDPVTAVAAIDHGFGRNSVSHDGAICTTAVDPAGAAVRRHGLKFDATGRVYVAVLP